MTFVSINANKNRTFLELLSLLHCVVWSRVTPKLRSKNSEAELFTCRSRQHLNQASHLRGSCGNTVFDEAHQVDLRGFVRS